MVSVSKLLGGSLILAGQEIFQNLASPEQAAVEQFNVVKFLGGSGPYLQRPGYGISTDIPANFTVDHVQLMSRHGERYPSINSGKGYEAVINKLKTYKGTFKGDLAFMNDYTYYVPDAALYEKETTPAKGNKEYSGTTTALKHGASFRSKYNSIYNPNVTLPIFSSTSGRVHQTADFFLRGFLGDNYEDDNVFKWSVLSENGTFGANSLTPRYGCPGWVNTSNAVNISAYDSSYLHTALARFQNDNPGLNLSASDISQFPGICAYELNVRGTSPFCATLTNEEYIRYSYSNDLSNYYSNGPGNNYSLAAASQQLNASLTLLKDTASANQIWLSFTHDTDVEVYLASIGITDIDSPLPFDQIPFPNPYVHSSIVPQAARLYLEKFSNATDSFVRYILNDAIVPIPKCSSGPGFSCKLSDFETYVNNRLNGVSYESCGKIPTGEPTQLTFYFDYNTTTYNEPLINA